MFVHFVLLPSGNLAICVMVSNSIPRMVKFVVGHTVFSCAIGTFYRDLENNANQFDNLPGFWPRTRSHPAHGLLFDVCEMPSNIQKKTLQKVSSLLNSPWASICHRKIFHPRKNLANNNGMDELKEA